MRDIQTKRILFAGGSKFHRATVFVKPRLCATPFVFIGGSGRARLPPPTGAAYMRAMRVRAVCFDYGGTLDGPGDHWLERFFRLYHEHGLALPWDAVRGAFDHATRTAYADPATAALDLPALVRAHAGWQMAYLGLDEKDRLARVTEAFVQQSHAALAHSRGVLARLRPRLKLGVISNFYGNLERVLADAEIAPLLEATLDSTCVGVQKPDAAIFSLAAARLACAPAEILYVGDSFEKDIAGAHAAGLRTAWLVGGIERACRAPELVDARLTRLDDLEALLE